MKKLIIASLLAAALGSGASAATLFDFKNDAALINAIDEKSGPASFTNSELVATFTASSGYMNYTTSGFGLNSTISGDDTAGFDNGEWIDITFDIPVTLTNVNVSSWSTTYGDEATIYVNGTSNGVITSTGDHVFEITVPSGQILRIAGTGGAITNNGWSLNSITLRTDTNPPPVVNSLPVLTSIGNKTVIEGNALNFTVSASDADNDEIVLSVTNLPSGASFNTVTNAGTVSNTFSWASATAGTYTPTFTADDGTTNVSETITITVSEIPLLLISEVADPADVSGGSGAYKYRFVEIYNAGTNTIDLAAGSWTLSRQNNGSTTVYPVEDIDHHIEGFICTGHLFHMQFDLQNPEDS